MSKYSKQTSSIYSNQGSFGLEIKQSTIQGAGLGVFLSDNSSIVSSGQVVMIFGDRIASAEETIDTPEERYSLENPHNTDQSRLGAPWLEPGYVDGPNAEVGHMLNDGAALQLPLAASSWQPTLDNFHQLVEKYKTEALSRQNVKLVEGDPNWRMISTRRLQPGEELFFK